MFGSFGGMELLLILIIVIIIFGAGKLPQLGEGIGKAIKGFKKSVSEADLVDAPPPSEPIQEPQLTPPTSASPPTEDSSSMKQADSTQSNPKTDPSNLRT